MKTNNTTTSTMDVLQQFILAEKGSPSPPPPNSGQFEGENGRGNPLEPISNNFDRRSSADARNNEFGGGGGKVFNESGVTGASKENNRSNESLSKSDRRFEKNLDKRRNEKSNEPKVSYKVFSLRSILTNGKRKNSKDRNDANGKKMDEPNRYNESNSNGNGTKGLNNTKDNANAIKESNTIRDTKPINGKPINDKPINGHQEEVNDSSRFNGTHGEPMKMDNGKMINNANNSGTLVEHKNNLDVPNRIANTMVAKSTTLSGGARLGPNVFVSREKEFATKSSSLDGRNLGRSVVGDQKPPLSPKSTQETGGRHGKFFQTKRVKAYCSSCKKKCSGEVLRVQDKYYHIACFQCIVCKSSLAQGGYFNKDGAYYCTNDYQNKFGTKCAKCGDFVEGEVVTALGNTYHQKCFTCGRCRRVFPSGDRVTYQGKEFFCSQCVQIPLKETVLASAAPISPVSNGSGHLNLSSNELCAGCNEELGEGQALIALDKQWHVSCFKCKACSAVLHGEYMGKDGVPYCEKDYQKEFGVKCAYCNRFIYGKVLQAGDNHHFHPTCAKCSKCGDLFGDGEEMYVQGGAIWHPKCGPGPLDPAAAGHILNGGPHDESGREFDRMSSSAASELQFAFRSRTPSFGSIYNPNTLNRKYTPYSARAGSPGLLLREYAGASTPGAGSHKSSYPDDLCMIYTYSYLTEEPTKGYLRRPIDPYDKPPTSPHFHRPHSSHSHRASSRASTLKSSMCGSRSGGGMRALLDNYRGASETPRSRSPHTMNNEEPISLAHFPAAKPPHNNEVPKIERDDFPAPPYPYSDPERRRRWSDSYKGVPVSDDEDEVDNAKTNGKGEPIQKLKKEEEELSKIASGIGKVFLRNVKEREKLQKWKQSHLDPRNASRTPSATKEPVYRLRYQSPINASPSRNLDAPRPWEEDEFDRTSSYRSSVGRSTGAIHSYNVVSSYRHNVPKPGYTMAPHRSHTFSSTGATSHQTAGDFSLGGLGDKTHSTNFSSGKSDVSNGSIYDLHHSGHHHTGGVPGELPVSSTYAGSLGYAASYSNHIQRSLPNMTQSPSLEPPKIYPYHLLIISNYRLPPDVDRNNLERHLSDVEFETLFLCNRSEFYRLPQWRRNELKKRARLF